MSALFLFGSIGAFIYFGILVCDSYRAIQLPDSFRFFGELLTIPFLLATLIISVVIGYKVFNKRADNRTLVSFFLSTSIIILLFVITLFQAG